MKKIALLASLSLMAIFVISARMKLVTYNITPSIAKGFYVRELNKKIQVGSIVRTKSPFQKKFDLLKYVVAMPGDYVDITPEHFIVNGDTDYGASVIGKEYTHTFKGETPTGYVFVAGTHPHSFDSRYFGPLSVQDVIPYKAVRQQRGK